MNTQNRTPLEVAVIYDNCDMASISLKDLLTIISEEMTKASTENKKSGKEVMTLLLEQRGTDVMITEEMMKTVTGNEESEKKSDDAFA